MDKVYKKYYKVRHDGITSVMSLDEIENLNADEANIKILRKATIDEIKNQ